MPPFKRKDAFIENDIIYECFFLEKDLLLFEHRLKKQDIYDIDNNVLNAKTVEPYLLEFAKGFNKGYLNFVDDIKKTDCFNSDNDVLAQKIFYRIVNDFMPFGSLNTMSMDIEKKGKYYITLDAFFKNGIKQGEFYKAWELVFNNTLLFEKYFTELQNKQLIVSNNKKEDITLEAIFTDKKDLEKLVKLLIERAFVEVKKNGSYLWTGKEDEKATGRALQLVALAEACRPLYSLNKYTGKDLHKAWTKFFNYEIKGVQLFTTGQISINITDSYKRLFNFVGHSFNL